jgi:hypothetical protein
MRDGNRINVVHMEGLNVVLCVCTHRIWIIPLSLRINESGMDTYTPGYRAYGAEIGVAASCRVAQLDGTGKWGEFTYETSLTEQFSAFWGLGIKVMKCIRGCHQTLAKLILVCSTPCLEVPATMNSTSETRLYVTRFRQASGMGNNLI